MAINDCVDSEDGENELAPFRNVMNEMYARDISRKVCSAHRIRGNSGEPLSQPPYGYMKSLEDKKKWIIDPAAAETVKEIFRMCIEGKGNETIARLLQERKILAPMAYWHEKGLGRGGKKTQPNPYKWGKNTVAKILAQQEYCGDIINFKTYSKSFKNKTRVENPKENWVVFKDVNEPIIDRETFEQIQKLTAATKRRAPKPENSQKDMFCDLLYCADCGKKLWAHTNTINKDIHFFSCCNCYLVTPKALCYCLLFSRNTALSSIGIHTVFLNPPPCLTRKFLRNNYKLLNLTRYYEKDYRGTCKSRHYIRSDSVEQVVLTELRRLTEFLKDDEEEFAELLEQKTNKDILREQKQTEAVLQKSITRSNDLVRLYEKLYEDNANGKVTDEWFMQLSHKYELEREELKQKTTEYREKLKDIRTMQKSKDCFLSAVRKYTEMQTLTPLLLKELIERIDVHEIEGTGKNRTQKIVIHYRFVGVINLPKKDKAEHLKLDTRQGVAVEYITA